MASDGYSKAYCMKHLLVIISYQFPLLVVVSVFGEVEQGGRRYTGHPLDFRQHSLGEGQVLHVAQVWFGSTHNGPDLGPAFVLIFLWCGNLVV